MVLQFIFVLTAIVVGARLGGIGLGVMGGTGLAVLTFVFGLQPTSPPIDVMLMIAAVISAAACHLIESFCYLFFSLFWPVQAMLLIQSCRLLPKRLRRRELRPERPLVIAVIASQQAITASLISAATVAMLALLAGFDITLFDILKITVPATLLGVLIAALVSMHIGVELEDDPEYKKRVL